MEMRAALLGAAAFFLALLVAGIYIMFRRMRTGSRQRASRTRSAQRRVAAATESAELGRSTIAAPDRFEVGSPGAQVRLTAEPRPGDLSAAVLAPEAPFDVTDAAAWQYWESCAVPRRRALMLAGYLSHPLPRVRVEALELLGSSHVDNPGWSSQLALLLLDDADVVRGKAARLVWGGKHVSEILRGLRGEADARGAEAVSRAYTELERTAPYDRTAALPHALAALYTDDPALEVELTELVGLYAPDRAPDLSRVAGIGTRIDAHGGADAMRAAQEALGLARGRDAADDLATRWEGVGPWGR